MSADMSEDDGGLLSVQDWPLGDVPGSPADSAKSDIEMEDKPSHGGTPSAPIQKRRRVTRACDECRRKKIKCDGKQPCTHCSVYSYECTYDKPSNRRRNPAPQYIEALEGRLQRAETLLRKFMPEVDLADPSLDPAIQQEFMNRERNRAAHAAKMRGMAPTEQTTDNDSKLTSMIDSVGHLDLDDKGGWDYHGISSGTVFMRRMRDHFKGLLGPQAKGSLLPPNQPSSLIDLDFASDGPGGSPPSATSPSLPSKDYARNLCYYSLSCATCLVRVVHVPTFYQQFERLYDKPREEMNRDEMRFLGLVYAVLALGTMYNNLDDTSSDRNIYQEAVEEGMNYYKAARGLLQDVTECRDITTLQALLFMILFLQATSSPSACYAFIGIALRSALRMGLHRHLQHTQLNPIEQETRSRVFYVIRQMDISVSSLLGYPLVLSKDDIDQAYPTEVDDEFIRATGIVRPPPGTSSFFEAFNAHTRLMDILFKITKYVYPVKGIDQSGTQGIQSAMSYQISYSRIKEIEGDLHQWYECLPESWRPSPDGPIEVVRVRHLLRFAYAHVQLVLYRPFLHYVSPHLSQGKKVDEVSYACAAAAISVSRNIVHIGLEIRKQRVLSGPYWFMLFTEYFAVLSLVFYAIENPDKPGSVEVLQDAQAGRQMIADLAHKSQAAERVTGALKELFDQLPEKMDQSRARVAAASKKRGNTNSKPGNNPGHYPILPQNLAPSRQDSGRSRSSLFSPRALMKTVSRSSRDSATEHPYQDPTSFTASMQDFMPLDISSRATPDSVSTTGSRPFQAQVLGSSNTVHKVDSVMFPSGDPFAYPNQPMMELGYQGKHDGSQISINSDNLFLGSLDELDPQLLGQPPPYMMQQHQNQALGLGGGMYDPAMMSMGMQQQAHQGIPAPPIHQTMPSRRAHVVRNQERQIDNLFTEQGMQPDWGSFFGAGRGGFQGM